MAVRVRVGEHLCHDDVDVDVETMKVKMKIETQM